MGENKKVPKPGARVALLNVAPDPNKERIAAIKQWHIDQAIGDVKPVALLNIAITASGEIVTQGIHIEPEHAQAMLPELQRIASTINAQLRPAKQTTPLRPKLVAAHIRPITNPMPSANRPAISMDHKRAFNCSCCDAEFQGWRSQELRIKLQGIEPDGNSSLCPNCHRAIHYRNHLAQR